MRLHTSTVLYVVISTARRSSDERTKCCDLHCRRSSEPPRALPPSLREINVHVDMTHIVIVGGGCGGVFTAKGLKGAIGKGIVEVTLVTPSEFVEWPSGNLRGLTVPKEADRAFAPSVVDCVKGATVVQGKAISVTSDAVIVASDQSEPVTVPYDLLVIATGGRYANPTTAFLKSPEVRSRCSIAAGLPHLSRLADNTPRTSSASERDGA